MHKDWLLLRFSVVQSFKFTFLVHPKLVAVKSPAPECARYVPLKTLLFVDESLKCVAQNGL